MAKRKRSKGQTMIYKTLENSGAVNEQVSDFFYMSG